MSIETATLLVRLLGGVGVFATGCFVAGHPNGKVSVAGILFFFSGAFFYLAWRSFP